MFQSGVLKASSKRQPIHTFPEAKKGKIIKKPDSLQRRIGLTDKVTIIAQQGDCYIATYLVGEKEESIKIPKSLIQLPN